MYRVVWVLKALWTFLSETINFLRKLHKTNIFGLPRKFYHRVMYIAPSSGHISLDFNMPFKLILRRFEVVFWSLEWECCTFGKIDGNSFKSTNTIMYYVFNPWSHLPVTSSWKSHDRPRPFSRNVMPNGTCLATSLIAVTESTWQVWEVYVAVTGCTYSMQPSR